MEIDQIKNSILEIRGIKVILDFELAKLYEVETRVLKQAVRRNIDRFPSDFMFQLTEIEMQHLVSQNVIPTLNHFGGAKPFAFIEQGIAMLSSVLKSKKAIHMNISIMRAFVLMRQWSHYIHRRLRYACHGILLSLLDFPADWVRISLVPKAITTNYKPNGNKWGIKKTL